MEHIYHSSNLVIFEITESLNAVLGSSFDLYIIVNPDWNLNSTKLISGVQNFDNTRALIYVKHILANNY